MAKIIGATTTTPIPRSDWAQQNENRADYILNKPDIKSLASKDIVERTDLSDDIKASLGKADSAEAYVDELIGGVNTAISEAKSSAETGDENTLAAAKQYADQVAAQSAQIQIVTWGADD